MLVTVENVLKIYSGNTVLKDINLKIEDNDRIGLIGVNGAGKSTLLKIIMDRETPDDGSISTANDISIGFLEQNSGLSLEGTIGQEMLSVFAHLTDMENQMREIEQNLSKITNHKSEEYNTLSAKYSSLESVFSQNDGYMIDVKIKTVIQGMGFADKAMDTAISTLSGGEKTRLAIAKLLLEAPKLLVLDEPTNHLDFKTLRWLEDYLTTYRGAILVVSHDRYFLDKIVTSICEIERNELMRYVGNYSKYIELKAEKNDRQQKQYDMQQKEIADLEDYVAKNLVRASTTKMAQSRRNTLEKMERISRPNPPKKPPIIEFHFDREPVKDVLHVTNLRLEVGDMKKNGKLLISSLNFDMLKGEKIAIVGANGVGKSSFLKAIQAMIPVENGKIEWGKNAKISYYEQENTQLNPENTALDELWNRHRTLYEQKIRSKLGAVLLTGEDVYKKVSVLSGGEKARLAMAILMMEKGNVLIMDEPTNHIDLATKEVVDKALQKFEGTILMVSHDRYLLNKVPTKIVEFFPNRIELYDGNYDYYLEKSNEVKAEAAQQKSVEKPQDVKYFRSKQQKNEELKRKKNITNLEMQINVCEKQIDELEAKIISPEVSSDYQLLTESCTQLEQLKNDLSLLMEQWLANNEEQN